jgi:hypothetical protein
VLRVGGEKGWAICGLSILADLEDPIFRNAVAYPSIVDQFAQTLNTPSRKEPTVISEVSAAGAD